MANIISSHAAPITLPKTTSLAPLFDFFASEEPTHTSHWKRLLIEDDEPDKRNVRAKLLQDEDEDLKLALRTSR